MNNELRITNKKEDKKTFYVLRFIGKVFPGSEFSSCSSFAGWKKRYFKFHQMIFSFLEFGKWSKTIGKSTTGFSLVETIVAVAIMVLAIIGPMSGASRSLISAEYSKDQMKAYYLAEEGLEYIHYVRDLNAVNQSTWLNGLGNCVITGNSLPGCSVDPSVGNTGGIKTCSDPENSSTCKLYFDNQSGIYSHQTGGNFKATTFRRWVKIYARSNDFERKVVVSVEWKTGALPKKFINVVGYITDWKEQPSL